MKIIALTENTGIDERFCCVHGLSFYIETPMHKILFDMGPDDTFIKNAALLDVNLEEVDIAFISHGHDDHGGALKLFMDINKKAKIYVRKNIFDSHYATHACGVVEIGLDKGLMESDRVVFMEGNCQIDDELFLFSGVTGRKYFSEANKTLYAEKDGEKVEDDFTHEQNLIITAEGKKVLIGGCAHNGIVNIMEKIKEIKGYEVDVVISGFHLMNPDIGANESNDLVEGVASELVKYGSKYYTCHCTGLDSYAGLKAVMKDQVDYIAAGQTVVV
ncbi:MAG: MBL fold metallo-hydrolase [Firmicutes bacterium]|nr:MBL fold metallo-hydrolase [Bacillota bacterium]